MNCPEKIAGTYLRLNGFFMLPHFTLFDGEHHSHVDFLGLRPPGGVERCRGLELPLDQEFFETVDELITGNSFNELIGTVVEVKGGNDRELPSEGHIQYARAFFGGGPRIIPVSFSLDVERIGIQHGTIIISLKHSLEWIKNRIDWMNHNMRSLTKTGSWAWSEEFLSDLLYLHRLG
jgi:hypothetical protein